GKRRGFPAADRAPGGRPPAGTYSVRRAYPAPRAGVPGADDGASRPASAAMPRLSRGPSARHPRSLPLRLPRAHALPPSAPRPGDPGTALLVPALREHAAFYRPAAIDLVGGGDNIRRTMQIVDVGLQRVAQSLLQTGSPLMHGRPVQPEGRISGGGDEQQYIALLHLYLQILVTEELVEQADTIGQPAFAHLPLVDHQHATGAQGLLAFAEETGLQLQPRQPAFLVQIDKQQVAAGSGGVDVPLGTTDSDLQTGILTQAEPFPRQGH